MVRVHDRDLSSVLPATVTSRQSLAVGRKRWPYRIRLTYLFVCLILVPWSIFALFLAQYAMMPELPGGNVVDENEIAAIASAVEAYADKYGEYPPDFTSDDPRREIDLHLAKCFPDRDPDLDVALLLGELGPENALGFWLAGFSSDATRPLTGSGQRQPLYPFRPQQLMLGYVYFPTSCGAPYIYFRNSTYDGAEYSAPKWGTIRPYLVKSAKKDDARTFAEPEGFQIVCAGVDGSFGHQQCAVSEVARHYGHGDNLTSFHTGPLALDELLTKQRQLEITCQASVALALCCSILYPFARQLRSRSDGVDDLRQMLARQFRFARQGDEWRQVVHAERSKRRRQAIERFAETGDARSPARDDR